MLLKAGLLTLLIILLLLVPVQVALSSSSYNLSDYPWLQTGTYMRYQIFNIGTGPDFVLPNGTLLVGLAYSSAQGNMTLVITNRSGDVVDLDINYSITGNATAQGQMFPTEYNYSTSIKVQVDIPTRMAYVDGKPEGIIPFWSVPLPTGGQSVLFSTVYVGGTPYNITANVDGPSDCTPNLILGPPMESQGKVYYCVKNYLLEDVAFGWPTSSSRFGWENMSGGFHFVGNVTTPSWLPMSPIGSYDYYNGLALNFLIPDYSINQTVCFIVGNSPTNCAYVSFSTTLGEYFRTHGANMALASTNVPLIPTETGNTPQIPWLLVASATVIATVSLSLLYLRRRRARQWNKMQGV
jgi:hypothetical protein